MKIQVIRTQRLHRSAFRNEARLRAWHKADTLEDAARVLRELGVPLDDFGRLSIENGRIVEIIGKFAMPVALVRYD